MTNSVTWKIEPHTRAKHDLLRAYLGAWFPIMSKFNKRLVMFDGFAGPGVYEHGEPGSPVIALRTLAEHHYATKMSDCEFVFLFNEHDRGRFARLQQSVSELETELGALPKNVNVRLSNSNFSALVSEILDSIGENRLAPTFAFVDPFGYKDVSMAQLKDFLGFPKCELFIYFDFNSANRFATSGQVDESFEQLYGTNQFAQAPPAGDPGRGSFLTDLYEAQLREVCKFPYVQRFAMVNSQGRTGNYIFYCTRSYTGLKSMKAAMWKIDPTGEYRFSDLLHGLPVLFTVDVDTAPLQEELCRVFRGKTVTVEEVEKHVVIHTPFAASHVKKKTLKPMQDAGRITCTGQRLKGTFPEGTRITFV